MHILSLLTPLPTCLRAHEANAARVQLYSIARDARLATAEDERQLAERVSCGLALQARLRTAAVPRCRALVAVR